MRSMTRYLKPSDICADLRMQRQTHKGVFVLLEGAGDFKRFKKFYSENALLINCWGKDNVCGAIDIEQNSARDDVIGFVDSDFDNIHGTVEENEDIIRSRFHDFDIDVCATEVFARYLAEVGDATKVAAEGGVAACIESLLVALKPLSALRYANVHNNLGYSLSNVDHAAFFNGHAVDVSAMIDHVSCGKFSSQEHKDELLARISQYTAPAFDLWQFTNGHDLIAALGIALRERLGNRHRMLTYRSEVERHLRLAFDVADFQHSGHLAAIRGWEQTRAASLLLAHVN